jgi:PilZ domain-containing protein
VETQDRVEGRLYPRFKLDANLKIRSRIGGLLSGYVLDISESGISAMLPIEVAMGEVVELDFELPLGRVNVRAVVRERNAFRYGFQFVQPNAAHQLIADACGSLAPCD